MTKIHTYLELSDMLDALDACIFDAGNPFPELETTNAKIEWGFRQGLLRLPEAAELTMFVKGLL